eukprot:264219-Rhodomonas_salina.2
MVTSPRVVQDEAPTTGHSVEIPIFLEPGPSRGTSYQQVITERPLRFYQGTRKNLNFEAARDTLSRFPALGFADIREAWPASHHCSLQVAARPGALGRGRMMEDMSEEEPRVQPETKPAEISTGDCASSGHACHESCIAHADLLLVHQQRRAQDLSSSFCCHDPAKAAVRNLSCLPELLSCAAE